MSLSVYVKDIDAAQSTVEFNDTNGLIRFKTRDANFLKQHSESATPQTLFEWNVDFFDQVQPQDCKYRINKSMMEINLRKKNTSNEKWVSPIKRTSLEAGIGIDPPQATTNGNVTDTTQTQTTKKIASASLQSSPPMQNESDMGKRQIAVKLIEKSDDDDDDDDEEEEEEEEEEDEEHTNDDEDEEGDDREQRNKDQTQG